MNQQNEDPLYSSRGMLLALFICTGLWIVIVIIALKAIPCG